MTKWIKIDDDEFRPTFVMKVPGGMVMLVDKNALVFVPDYKDTWITEWIKTNTIVDD